MTAPVFTTEALGGQTVDLAALRGRTVLLKFYRFATCPVCNLHLHRFIAESGQLEALGLTTVVLYHSPAAKVETAQTAVTPFDLVADPQKRIFRAYGVETSWAGMFSVAVMRDYIKALLAGFPPGMLTSDGGITGNPADFLIDADGKVALAHYGRNYADSLTAGDVAAAYRRMAPGQTRADAGVGSLQTSPVGH